MNREKVKEEYLESLWYMAETANKTFEDFKQEMGDAFEQNLVDELKTDGLIAFETDDISLTKEGRDFTRQLIRSHRIAERLVHDVLGG